MLLFSAPIRSKPHVRIYVYNVGIPFLRSTKRVAHNESHTNELGKVIVIICISPGKTFRVFYVLTIQGVISNKKNYVMCITVIPVGLVYDFYTIRIRVYKGCRSHRIVKGYFSLFLFGVSQALRIS